MYKILVDYGSEGWKFEGQADGYASLDDAVKYAIKAAFHHPFIIVQPVNWVAIPGALHQLGFCEAKCITPTHSDACGSKGKCIKLKAHWPESRHECRCGIVWS